MSGLPSARRSCTREERGVMSDNAAHVVLDKSRCEACWHCVEECPHAVLRKVQFLGHKHAKIKAVDLCAGCGRCVRCLHGRSAVAGAPGRRLTPPSA